MKKFLNFTSSKYVVATLLHAHFIGFKIATTTYVLSILEIVYMLFFILLNTIGIISLILKEKENITNTSPRLILKAVTTKMVQVPWITV